MGCTRKVDVSDDKHLTDKIWNKIGHMIPEPETANRAVVRHILREPVLLASCLY